MHFLIEISKCVIYVCNSFLSISGTTLLLCGAILKVNEANYHNLIDKHLSVGTWAWCVGLALIITILLGTYATYKDFPEVLAFFAGLLVTVFIFQVSLGVFTAITINPPPQFEQQIKTRMKKLFDEKEPAFMESLHKIEKDYKCCGINGVKDYDVLPKSCCLRRRNNTCVKFYEVGCSRLFPVEAVKFIKIIAYVALVFAMVEVLGAWLALSLRQRVKNEAAAGEDGSDSPNGDEF